MDKHRDKYTRLIFAMGSILFIIVIILSFCLQKHKEAELSPVAVLEHNPTFTEGLFFYNNVMYESSGKYNESVMYRYSDGYSVPFDNDIFLEGSTVLNDRLYALTFQENKAFQLDTETFEIIKEYSYPTEGWGLTTDGQYLIASDGTDRLFYFNEEFHMIKTVQVTENGNPVRNINELEYIEGYIFANIWLSKDIVVIDPESGNIVYRFYVAEKTDSPKADVLNGIAYDGKYMYLTGKYYYEIWKYEIQDLLAKIKIQE